MKRASILLVALAALARMAHADEPLADQKFDRAQKLREAGKLAESCALFRESLQLNANAIGTLLNVARCDEEQGKVGSAFREFTDARDRATEQQLGPQREAAEQHLRALVDRVPHLALAFAAPLPNNARIAVDDVAVAPDAASDVIVDPGSVRVVVSAPGFVAFETHVAIAEHEHKVQVIPKLEPPVIVHNSRRVVGKILTFVGGGAAVAALGIGIGAKVDYDGQLGMCTTRNGATVCPPNTSNRANNDHTLGNLATGLGVGGLVVGAVGASLWLLWPASHEHRVAVVPTLAPGQAGVAAAWRF